jgi:hypothetical protein
VRWESETALRELIEVRTREFESEMLNLMHLPDDASEPSEVMLTAMMELADLTSELEFLRDSRPGSGEPDAPVCVPLNPRPCLNSGSVALPEPDEPQQ